MKNTDVIFSLTVNDFNAISKVILGREFDQDELEMIKRKFVIENWVEIIEDFIYERFEKDE